MRKASEALEKATQLKVEEADDTTLAVNEQEITANNQLIKLADHFVQAFEKDINRILLSAEKFDDLDKQMSKGGVR